MLAKAMMLTNVSKLMCTASVSTMFLRSNWTCPVVLGTGRVKCGLGPRLLPRSAIAWGVTWLILIELPSFEQTEGANMAATRPPCRGLARVACLAMVVKLPKQSLHVYEGFTSHRCITTHFDEHVTSLFKPLNPLSHEHVTSLFKPLNPLSPELLSNWSRSYSCKDRSFFIHLYGERGSGHGHQFEEYELQTDSSGGWEAGAALLLTATSLEEWLERNKNAFAMRMRGT